MTTRHEAKTLTRAGQRVIAATAPVTIHHLHHVQQTAVIINIPPRLVAEPVEAQTNTLSSHLENGRQFHPLCRHAFIEQIELGYYHYERRSEYRTCALAAAYAGAFGARSVERPDFSYSMALWQLSQKLGYDLRTMAVPGPTGRCQAVADEMMSLVDGDGWSRAGVVAWLKSLEL